MENQERLNQIHNIDVDFVRTLVSLVRSEKREEVDGKLKDNEGLSLSDDALGLVKKLLGDSDNDLVELGASILEISNGFSNIIADELFKVAISNRGYASFRAACALVRHAQVMLAPENIDEIKKVLQQFVSNEDENVARLAKEYINSMENSY